MTKRALFRGKWLPVTLLAPQMLIIFIFFYWPSAQAMYWSFTLERPFGGGAVWVGLDNLRNILNSAEYRNSITVTLIFSAATTALAMAAGLILAIATDRGLRGMRQGRIALIWPYAVAAPAAALAFQFVFHPSVGIFSYLNDVAPGTWSPRTLGTHAMIMVIVCAAWKQTAYNFLFFLAALQAVPKSIIEAGAVDGAGPLRRVKDLILPMMTPTIFFLLIINITEAFTDSFGIIHVMTQGGPGGATNLMVYKIYADGFIGLDLSGSAAQSLILMVLVILLTAIQFRFIERRVHYQ